MLFVDKYFQVVEKESVLVPKIWKASHVISLFGIATNSFAVGYCFAHILAGFGNYCIFGAKLQFKPVDKCYAIIGNFTQNTSFYNSETFWGRERDCSPISSFFIFNCIVAMILLSFFLILSRGGSASSHELYSSPWQIVLPALVISIGMTIMTIAALAQLQVGLEDFCDQFEPVLNSTKCPESIDEYTLIFYQESHRVSFYIILAEVTAYATLFFWVVLIVSLLVRLLKGVDFKIIVYNLERTKHEVRSSTTSASLTDLQHEDDHTPLKVRARITVVGSMGTGLAAV